MTAFAMAVKNYRESTKQNMPKRWFDELPHNHVALSDAIGQGALFKYPENKSRENAPKIRRSTRSPMRAPTGRSYGTSVRWPRLRALGQRPLRVPRF